MLETLPTTAEQLAPNLKLPESLRQNAVLLEFAKPIRRSWAGQFLLIRLTPNMLAGGEEEFYLTHIVQPHRVPTESCRFCRQPMHRESLETWRCHNPRCFLPNGQPTRSIQQHSAPARGVVKLLITDDCVDHVEYSQVIDRFLPDGKPIYRRHSSEWLKAVVLLLDRRYRPEVLAAVKRTAGEICDIMGWQLAR
jgi:hypothetical protein